MAMAYEKTGGFVAKGIGTLLKTLVRGFSSSVPRGGMWNSFKLYGKGVIDPYKSFSKPSADLNQAVNKLTRAIDNKSWSHNQRLFKNYVDNAVSQGPKHYEELTSRVKDIIKQKIDDPRYKPITVTATGDNTPAEVAANIYRLGGNKFTITKENGITSRAIKLDQYGSIKPSSLYHELGHADQTSIWRQRYENGKLAKFLGLNNAKLAEEARAGYNGYVNMRHDGFPHMEASDTFFGFPSYFYHYLPYNAAQLGRFTGKYIAPAGAAAGAIYGMKK